MQEHGPQFWINTKVCVPSANVPPRLELSGEFIRRPHVDHLPEGESPSTEAQSSLDRYIDFEKAVPFGSETILAALP